MNSDEFRQSLTATAPPAGLTHALAGLWWDAKGDWAHAHEVLLSSRLWAIWVVAVHETFFFNSSLRPLELEKPRIRVLGSLAGKRRVRQVPIHI